MELNAATPLTIFNLDAYTASTSQVGYIVDFILNLKWRSSATSVWKIIPWIASEFFVVVSRAPGISDTTSDIYTRAGHGYCKLCITKIKECTYKCKPLISNNHIPLFLVVADASEVATKQATRCIENLDKLDAGGKLEDVVEVEDYLAKIADSANGVELDRKIVKVSIGFPSRGHPELSSTQQLLHAILDFKERTPMFEEINTLQETNAIQRATIHRAHVEIEQLKKSGETTIGLANEAKYETINLREEAQRLSKERAQDAIKIAEGKRREAENQELTATHKALEKKVR